MSQEKSEVLELPGVGEFRARPGTATHELAGAASFWHKKYQSARKDGFIAASVLIASVELAALILYTLIWR